jgi:threonine dehydratase
MSASVDPREIERVHATIAPYIRVTPIVDASGADVGLPPIPLTLKLEQLQHAGSFKTRGAFANLLLRHPPAAGVVAASGGNHGAAVAYAAMRLNIPARIFVPTVSSPAKIARIRSYGAELTVIGDRYAEALAASIEWAETSGALQVHAFDQRETIAGQGTLGLELSKQAPQLDTILVAVGGGGLIGGLAAWYQSSVRIVAVEPEGAPTLAEAIKAGRPVDAPRRRHRRRFARASPGRRADVSHRHGPRRSRRAGHGRSDTARAAGTVGGHADRRRAGRFGGLRRAAVPRV